MMPFGGISKL